MASAANIPPRGKKSKSLHTQTIRDRIKELRFVAGKDIRQNPKNWRHHPNWQRNKMRGVLEEIGMADAVLVRDDGKGLILIDGEMRHDLLKEQQVPALILDVNEQEADLLLATLDPITAMADTNQEKFVNLLGSLKPAKQQFKELLAFLNPIPGAAAVRGRTAASSPAAADTRMVQLFFNGTEREQFDKKLAALQTHFGVKSITDAVLESLRYGTGNTGKNKTTRRRAASRSR